MNVALVQLDIAWENPEENFRRVRELTQRSNIPKDSLVVLPEMFSTGFSMDVEKTSDNETGRCQSFLADLAAELKSAVIGGYVLQAENGMGMNVSSAYLPNGSSPATYQKIHPFTFGEESKHFVGGKRLSMFEWCHFNICPTICYDLRFPELYRWGVSEGAELFTIIASWPETRIDHWKALIRARAIENQAYVVGVNRCGSDPNVAYCGSSMAVDPKGNIIIEMDSTSKVTQFSAEIGTLRAYRAKFPAIADMRITSRFQ